MTYIYLTNIINFIVCVYLYDNYLHIYQLKDYKNIRYLKYFIKKSFIFAIYLVFFVLFLINYLFFENNLIFNINVNLLLIFTNAIHSFYIIKSNKTPINYTARIKHLYLISTLLLAIINATPFGVILSCSLLLFLPIAANALNIIDRARNKKFIKAAKAKLQLNNTRIIAITGSNGKTSVKNILHTMLSKKYATQMTPKSYNTELGIAKFINEELSDNTEFLILEYGARDKGDIKKLCKLFGADYGIITSVAPQHLETFHSIENVYKTKKELPDYLQAELCVYNLDNDYSKIMYQEKLGKKIGISIKNHSSICADNIHIINGNTNFDLNIKGNIYHTKTKLLGRHNVTNILLATALAEHLNIKHENIIDAIENQEPIPHRLELIQTNINILDDTYNCSIESAREAIWTLSQFPASHTVATPGIIEGGKEQYNINFELGKMLAQCDMVIIIGKTNLKAINDGLNAKNYSKKLILADNLESAKNYFSKIKEGDILLLLNDLPDDYD